MARLTLDEFTTVPTLKEREVPVPEFGPDKSVLVREFTKEGAQRLKAEATNPKGEVVEDDLEILMIIRGVAEPQLDTKHMLRLRRMPNGVIERIKKVVLELNGWTTEAQQAADVVFPPAAGRDDQRDAV